MASLRMTSRNFRICALADGGLPDRAKEKGGMAALAGFALFACSAIIAPAAHAQQADAQLADLSLEQLSRIRVTSVSRRSEPLVTAAASIYVISNEDIRRSGARTLPEALRLAPNLQVAQLNAREYAISARGFNSTAANKLLVQLDGRSLYTPLFSGVFWDAQDVMLADVDRIEVISGPGATLWGSNASNGVINIITRRAKETRGGLMVASTGNAAHAVAARYGANVASEADYRVYAKRNNYEVSRRANDVVASDAWQKTQAGFRFDKDVSSGGLTVQGDAYDGSMDPTRPERQTITGSNLLVRWNGATEAGGRQTVRFIYDDTHRHAPGTFEEQLRIYDLLLQQDSKLSANQNIIFGANYRLARDRIVNSPGFAFLPADKDLRWASVFAQDDVALAKKTRASIGARAEYNGYTHWEFLPSLRLSHSFDNEAVVWGSLSRSVRAPSRIDRELYSPEKPPHQLAGGPEFGSEVANTAELGYREQLTSSLSYSLTTFYERFKRLRAGRINNKGALEFNNGLNGQTYGVEGWTTYRLNRQWRFDAGFTRFRMHYVAAPGSVGNQSSLGNDPNYQWQVRSTWDASRLLNLSVSVRHVAGLPQPVVPSYTAVDLHGAYKVLKDTSVTLSVLNAQGGDHREFGGPPGSSSVGSEFGPAVYLGLSVAF